MSVINMARTIKQIHPNALIMYKVGSFYQTIGKDAYITSYLFGYKLTDKSNLPVCGFPERAITKVKNKLENTKLDYLLLDTRNNYDVDEKSENKNLNSYDEVYEKAKTYMKRKNRIDRIYNELIDDINSKNIREKLKRVEEVLDEEWKI